MTIPLPMVTPGREGMLSEGEHPFKHVEIQINTACCCDCFGCDRFSDVISDQNMTVAQVARFVDESLELRWKWDRVRILGGEPTLHPHLELIVKELMRYRRFHPKVFLQLLSNGRGKLNNTLNHSDDDLLNTSGWRPQTLRNWLIDRGIDPHVEAKEPGVTPHWFANTRLAPIDRDPAVGELEPCGIFGVHGCGIGLTAWGFFLDGAGASVARVSGLDIGVQHLKDVTWQVMLDQARVLCRLCGHWNPPDADPAKPETMATKLVSVTGEVTGAWWTEKIAQFKKCKPKMTVYGG